MKEDASLEVVAVEENMIFMNKKYPITCEGIWGGTMNVTFCSVCDNNCNFCIARHYMDSVSIHKIDVEAMIKTTRELKPSMMEISGGEPFLFMNDLEKFIDGVRDIVKTIRVFTSLPLTVKEKWDQFTEIYDKIDSLVCSYQHYDSDLNNFLYKASSDHDRVELLRKVAEYDSDKLRVNMNLVRYGFDCRREIDRGLMMLRVFGVKHVRINELQDAEDDYVDFQKEYKMKLPSPYLYGCCRPVKLRKFKDMDIYVKLSCFKRCAIYKPTKKELRMLKKRNSGAREENQCWNLKEDGTYSFGF